MFTATSGELYKHFRKKYKNLPELKEGITFKAWEPDFEVDSDEIHYFYKDNAPIMAQLHSDTFKRRKLAAFFYVHDVYLISAYRGSKLLGHMMLLYDDEFKFYHVIYPCVRKQERGKDISAYMVLCAMRFAKDVLERKEIRVRVYDETFPNMKSLKGSLIKFKPRKNASVGKRYNYRREMRLYRIFEEVLGLKLVKMGGHIYYVIKL